MTMAMFLEVILLASALRTTSAIKSKSQSSRERCGASSVASKTDRMRASGSSSSGCVATWAILATLWSSRRLRRPTGGRSRKNCLMSVATTWTSSNLSQPSPESMASRASRQSSPSGATRKMPVTWRPFSRLSVSSSISNTVGTCPVCGTLSSSTPNCLFTCVQPCGRPSYLDFSALNTTCVSCRKSDTFVIGSITTSSSEGDGGSPDVDVGLSSSSSWGWVLE
mmetsp:Transcript_14254/g.43166  ORF Transcript_14254/g.43166 Transcript_14254/m.43166 type:complete len:224 (-) Transcript_14254:585-1256(-)